MKPHDLEIGIAICEQGEIFNEIFVEGNLLLQLVDGDERGLLLQDAYWRWRNIQILFLLLSRLSYGRQRSEGGGDLVLIEAVFHLVFLVLDFVPQVVPCFEHFQHLANELPLSFVHVEEQRFAAHP